MKIAKDDLWLCTDCTMVACNGLHGIELEDRDATINGLAKLGMHLVPSFDSETEEGILTFSRIPCDSCGTHLAGYRVTFAILEEE